jgi:hypothetical protein
LSANAVGWLESDIEQWLAERKHVPATRRSSADPAPTTDAA